MDKYQQYYCSMPSTSAFVPIAVYTYFYKNVELVNNYDYLC